MSHWRGIHPPPDPQAWLSISPFERRVRRAVTDLYRWYDENGDDLYPRYRDAAFTPATTQRARTANTTLMVDAVLSGPEVGSASRRRRAVVGHVLGFWAWRSLRVEQELSRAEAVNVAADMILGVARP